MAYRKIKPILRETLLNDLRGFTVADLAVRTGIEERQLRRALDVMEDVYIDHWYPAKHQKPAQAVYRIVVVPNDCPKPTKKPNEKRTYNRRVS